MKNNFLIIIFICIFINLNAKSEFKYDNKNSLKDLIEKDKTIFLGNSITEFWPSFTQYFEKNEYINKGISGQTTIQMLLRFNNDVIKLTPKNVVILAGINDLAQNSGPIKIERIAANIIKMSDLARLNNIQVFICSVLPVKAFPWRKKINPIYKIIKLNNLLKQYCKKENIVYVDFYSKMVDWNGGLKVPEYTSENDLVHPNKNGYLKMESILKERLK